MDSERKKYRIEIAQTILLSSVILVTAWSGYQASVWDGVQSIKIAEAYAAGRMASEKAIVADNNLMLDGILVVNLADAVIGKRTEVVDFYLRHVPREFGHVLNAWLAALKLENVDPPPHPLAMAEYKEKVIPLYFAGVAELEKKVELKFNEAREAKHTSSEYVFATVLLSSVLFIGGIVPKVISLRTRLSLLVLAYGVAVWTCGLLLNLPRA